MQGLTIAYITESAASDRHAWSGTVHFVYTALENRGHNVIPLGPARPMICRLFLAGLNKISLVFAGKRIDYRHSILYSKSFSAIFSKKLRTIKHDIVVVCGTTECGAYLQSEKPVIYVLDRTIAGALNYHLILSDLWSWSQRQSVYTDAKAMRESSMLLFSSTWAAEHAKSLYRISEEKVRVIPFGANMDNVPTPEEALAKKSAGNWSLLFIGTSWKNKGADIAVKTLKLLNEKGVKASLTVVGCEPAERTDVPGLTIIPFIDKNSETGQQELWKLFQEHHVFILPTRFDCTPIVLCEASAFSLPVLCSNTGGVAGHVEDGVNGYLIEYSDEGPGYAEKIMEWDAHPEKYDQVRKSARAAYDDRLNWQHWAQEFDHAVKTLL